LSQRARVTLIIAIFILLGLSIAWLNASPHERAISATQAEPTLPPPTPAAALPRFEQQRPCAFPVSSAWLVGKDVLCGVVVVPELHSQPQGKQLRLAVTVYKRQGGSSPSDAVIFLEGGPGGSAANIARRMMGKSFYDSFTQQRDAIVFDQRGTGLSSPALDCDTSPPRSARGSTPIDFFNLQPTVGQAQACQYQLQAQGVNLAAYNSSEDAADINDIRLALGYDKLDVYAVSYGTLLAQALMRDYPAAIRDVVLDSVVPLGVDIYALGPASFDRSLSLLFAYCNADPGCRNSYPNLADVFARDVRELNLEPVTLPVSDSVSGKSYHVSVDGNRLVNELHHGMYSTTLLPHVPQLLYAVNNRDYRQLAALVSANDSLNSNISEGVYYSMQCADMVRSLTPVELDAELVGLKPEINAAKRGQEADLQDICQQWPGNGFNQPRLPALHSALPTLVLSGDFDPITPQPAAREVARNLTNGYFVALPTGAHGSGLSEPCAFGIMTTFLDDAVKPNTACTAAQRIQFVTAP
jgi:pimeloyl-ACP methyl ester carboxylesterase